MTIYLPQLNDDVNFFPDVDKALTDPDGLLAMGGDLSPARIKNAYQHGIFPWFSEGEPLLWWSPSERATITAGQVHISKSMKRLLNKNKFSFTLNQCFADVINACAKPRQTQSETWITNEMINAYIELHHLGVAHSVEVWLNDKLVGGLYGICVGQMFCGESMFSQCDNSSKMAFIALNQYFESINGKIIDCQMMTAHLKSLGVAPISRETYIGILNDKRKQPLKKGCWRKQNLAIKI